MSGFIQRNPMIAIISGSVAVLSGTISEMSGTLSEISGTQSQLSGTVGIVSGAVGITSGTVGTSYIIVNSMSGTQSELSGTISQLSSTVGTINTVTSLMNGTVSSISSNVITMSGAMYYTSGTISELSGTISQLSGTIGIISGTVSLIDGKSVYGMASGGVKDSLAYKVHEIEKHLHGSEFWVGKSADQSGNDWGSDTLTPFVATSGNGTYGADLNDEAKVIGTADVPISGSYVYYDVHRIIVTSTSSATVYKLRFVWDATDMATGIAAGQVSEYMLIVPAAAKAVPVDVMMPRIRCGTDKLWCQCKNITNDSTVSFFVGFHQYIG